VAQAMREMGEVGTTSPDIAGELDSLLDVEMGRVWVAEPEGVQDQRRDALERLAGPGAQRFCVGDVSEIAEAEAEDGDRTVLNREGVELERTDVDVFQRFDHPEPELWLGRAGRWPEIAEDIVEAVPKRPLAVGACMDIQAAAVARGDRPQVIDAMDVVGVAVGDPDSVDRPDTFTHKLESQLGRGIDEDRVIPILNEGGMAGPLVAAVIGRAGGAVAPDDGNAERRAGPEEREPHNSSTRSMFVVPATWKKGSPAVTTTRSPSRASPLPSSSPRAQAMISP